MKLNKDAKIAIFLVSAFVLMAALYGVVNFYNHRTGKLETEYIFLSTETQTIAVNGFAVRDENISVDGENTLIFYKNDSLVYVPIISDSENIGKNGVIALGFSDESEASAYTREMEMREKLANIREIASKQELNHNNVLFLNSQISTGVANYIKKVTSGNLSDVDSYIDSVASNITSRQSAIGEEISYDDIIKDYTKQIKQLESSYTIKKKITSPYAGYFIGNVDGYESSVNYDSIANKSVKNGDGANFLALNPADVQNAYGKLIAQHTWYYIFDLKATDASIFRTGYWVSAAFDDLGIKDIDMKVYDVTEEKDGMITVTLVCTAMNEDLAKIRKEPARITVKEFKGFKIGNDAINENEDGVMGVYAVVGNIIKFSPIEVLYYGDDYVIAEGVTRLKDENNKSLGYYHKLKHYDKIIVKGINLEDGNIVS